MPLLVDRAYNKNIDGNNVICITFAVDLGSLTHESEVKMMRGCWERRRMRAKM
jgi:hypothetical protein